MNKLAIFDVDFTITKKETLLEFYKFLIKKDKKFIKYLPYVLWTGVLYILKLKKLKEAKQVFITFVNNAKEEEIKLLSKEFYDKVLINLIYKDAIKAMEKFKKQGYLIYLISASAEFYLAELYDIKFVDMIIGNRVVFQNGTYKSIIKGENCKGEEKVKRLMEVIKEKKLSIDFENSYMFSDSMSDEPLFKLVGNPYLINYKKKNPKYKVLRWE